MASPSDRNLVINAALAEYTALRAEVTSRINGQDTTLNLYIRLVSAYLNDQLRPLITDRLGEPGLLGWQANAR